MHSELPSLFIFTLSKMFPFSYIHFTRMVKELEKLKESRLSGFFYEKNKRIGYLDFNSKKLYFDLTHPFVSFFIIENIDVPAIFEKKEIGIEGLTLEKVKGIKKDRVVYLVLRKKSLLRVVALELTGKASYFLVIDDDGKIVRKYPPYRRRKKGGDVGEEYHLPPKNPNVNIKKYFPVLQHVEEDELLRNFLEAESFYTDGNTILPFEFEGSVFCGGFSECMFSLYRKLRFGFVNVESHSEVPYYIYYKAASMLQKGLIVPVDNELNIDGYRIVIPGTIRDREESIEYLYRLGKIMRLNSALRTHSKSETARGRKSKLISPSGYEVLVGHSAKENNRITFNIARHNDTFFHVRDYPGAHVILRNHGEPITEDDIVFCAQLARKFSRARGDSVDVSYTSVKYIRPIPGKPGKVILLKEKSVRV